jgi:hypothetical protein
MVDIEAGVAQNLSLCGRCSAGCHLSWAINYVRPEYMTQRVITHRPRHPVNASFNPRFVPILYKRVVDIPSGHPRACYRESVTGDAFRRFGSRHWPRTMLTAMLQRHHAAPSAKRCKVCVCMYVYHIGRGSAWTLTTQVTCTCDKPARHPTLAMCMYVCM